jgi:hypothetical protein
LQLQAAFTRLGIAFAIRLDNQTQAGVFTDRTNFGHGGMSKITPSAAPSPGQRSVERRAFCGKKARNDLKWRFGPWVVGLQERFFRCQNREFIQITNRSGCSARAEQPLKHVPPTKAISTWKSAPLVTHFSPASRSWSILPAVLSGSVASTPNPMRVNPTRPRLPRPSKRARSGTEASASGGLFRVKL